MSVRSPSRRKALKYGAMAALGLGAVVALGEATGADRLVHAASPSGSDPVFSGTGIQFPSLTSDPSQLVGNMWYRSDLTAMKYSDGTNAHQLAALDLAQTWTGVQTFNANPVLASGVGITWGGATGNIGSASAYPATVYANALTAEGTTPTITGFSLAGTYNIGGAPTLTATLALNGQTLSGASTFTGVPNFNAGIIFNAAGSIASTSTYIEADGAGGNMILNVPTGKQLQVNFGGLEYLYFSSVFLSSPSDNTINLGANSQRWASVNAVKFNVYTAANDAQPSMQATAGQISLGAGGSSALDTTISRAAAGVVGLPGFKTAAGGTAPTTVSLTSGTAYTPSTTQNTIVTIGGGTVTAIAINGTTTGLTSGTFYLKANDTITVTFSAAPTALQMVA